MNKLDFIAIDFETANSNMDSACSIGIAAVSSNEIVDSFYSLVKPPENRYSPINIKVHHITPEQTESAPSMSELLPSIEHFFSPHVPVVAHNAHFDMSVLKLTVGAALPDFVYVDSMRIASPFVEGGLSLAHCADVFNLDISDHHNASADAEVCAKVVMCLMGQYECFTLWELLAKNPSIPCNLFSALKPSKRFNSHKQEKHFPTHARPSDIVCTVDTIDHNCALYGKNIVFTGELSVSREDAMQAAINAGAVLKSAVSRHTDYLVVGNQDKRIVGEDGLSSKQERAYELINSGIADIKIISESEFIKLIRR